MINYPAKETPISFPIPKVIAAAAKPKKTCRNPENQTFFPVNKVMAAPIINNPRALNTVLRTIALTPSVNMKGKTGITAPIPNKMKDEIAASIAEPLSSSELIPNSSFTKT